MVKDGKLIIAFEGNHGVGKTTQCMMLCDYLEKRGFVCKYIKFPMAGIQEELLSEISKRCESQALYSKFEISILLYETIKEVFELLNGDCANEILIFDRYKYSGRIFLRDEGVESNLLESLLSWLPSPDILLYLDLDVETIIERIDMRGIKNRKFDSRENIEFLSTIFLPELENAEGKYYKIDSINDVKQVHKEIVDVVNSLL